MLIMLGCDDNARVTMMMVKRLLVCRGDDDDGTVHEYGECLMVLVW